MTKLPTESAERKALPIMTGVLDYFPDALIEVAKVSKVGNDKHNPGQPLHWARGKSMDQVDACVRHLLERGGVDEENGLRHSAEAAWRALANLQIELEEAGLAEMSRGSRNADVPMPAEEPVIYEDPEVHDKIHRALEDFPEAPMMEKVDERGR